METSAMAQTAGLPAGTLVGAGLDGGPGVDAWLAANWSLLLRAARGVLSGEGEAVEAEDAAQDAAVKIWRHCVKFSKRITMRFGVWTIFHG